MLRIFDVAILNGRPNFQHFLLSQLVEVKFFDACDMDLIDLMT